MGKCPFCDSDCRFIENGFNQQTICNTCGVYFFNITVQHIIKYRGNEIPKQSKANIAFQNLKNQKESPQRRLFWIGKGETKQFLETNKGSTDKFLEFEEFENEPTDHAEKPYLLLDLIGSKVKETFDRCEITKKDMILAKIISDEELGKLLNILMEKGIFSPTNTYRAFGGKEGRSIGKSSVGLTLEGWDLFEKRKKEKVGGVKQSPQEVPIENPLGESKDDYVFISYSRDSPEHIENIKEFSRKLRDDSIETQADFYVSNPPEGWPKWMERMIKGSKFTLVVSSVGYVKKLEEIDSMKGKGVKWEGGIITQEIYEAGNKNEKFIPVYYGDSENVPSFLRRWTHYDLTKPEEYEHLYARISNQFPAPPPIGLKRKPNLTTTIAETVPPQKPFRLNRNLPDVCEYCGYPNEMGVHKMPANDHKHDEMACSNCKTNTIPICAIGMGHFIYVCENCGNKWSNL